MWFASDLIDWQNREIIIPEVDIALGEHQWWAEDQVYEFRFLSSVVPELKQLLTLMLQPSPVNLAYFLTDYQFGPSEGMQRMNYTVPALFEEHQRSGLRWNCLYHLVKQ